MARAPDSRIEQAKAMYLQGAKLVEIASQLNLPEGTVRRWKSTHKWDSERSDKDSERSDRKKDTSKVQKAVVLSEVESVIQNPDLSDKQRLFCIYYIRCFNATKAYQKAYGCDYITAAQNGSRMLKNAKVKAEIQRLKQDRLNRVFLDEHDIFQKYMDIAFADMTDYVEFGREKVQVMGAFGPIEVENPKTGKKEPLMKEVNTVRLRESTDVDGTIIAEVKQGRDGAAIKLADRMKALEWLTQHMNMATEEQKARIDVMRSKLGEDGNEAEAYDWMKAVIQEDGE